MSEYTIESHFIDKDPEVHRMYAVLLEKLRELGDVHEAPKKSSIHLDNASGFAGVYTRKNFIRLHFRLDYELNDSRLEKVEQLSAKRYKHTVKLETLSDIDEQLLTWLKDAYELAGG